MMWATTLKLILSVGFYFLDIGIDILVGRQQIEKTFPEYKFGGQATNKSPKGNMLSRIKL